MKKIILYELNEVPLKIIKYYMESKPNSWLAKNFKKFKKYETITENQGHLSPWNTWPTLHRGVPSSKHFIADFNQDLTEVDKEFPTIWEVLSKKKVKVGVFGSLHSSPVPQSLDSYGFYVPDVFAPNHECFPKNVELFQKINLKLSRGSARNVDSSLPYLDAIKLLFNAPSIGFKPTTFKDVGQHLIAEKLDSWKVVRRRTFQAVLSFDVFYKLLVKNKPDFVTFFTNHVASSMHRYWAASFPSEYENLKYNDQWINTYENEIIFTMDYTDRMLSKLSKFVDKNPSYKLVLTSSMGQEAVESEPTETQLSIKDEEKFVRMIGIEHSDDFKILPGMFPQFNFTVNEIHSSQVEQNLKDLRINGEKITYRLINGNMFSVDLGQRNLKEVNITVGQGTIRLEDSGLENLIIQDRSSSTAYHIPEGHLFSYHPSNTTSEFNKSQLATCDILPIMMNNFGLKKEAYMNQPKYVDL